MVSKEDEENFLIAYYELENNIDLSVKNIREKLTEILPDYMVPSVYLKIEHMPLTPNGKIDRKVLPKVNKKDFMKEKYIAPRTDIEKKLVGILEEVLGVKHIGIEDNFFDLGGHSLKAVKFINKIHEETGTRLNIKSIFENPTIEQIALLIKNRNEYVSIPKAPVQKYYDMSSTQKRIYLINDMYEDKTSYNMPASINIKGDIVTERVESTFNEIIKNHESLRTSFHVISGNLVQKIEENVTFKVNYIFVDKFDENLIKDFIKPFDLTKAPLLRVAIVIDKDNNKMMLFDMHHIISDGESVNIIINEFNKIYNGQQVDYNKIDYKDYSEWMKSRDLSNEKKYWMSQFSDEIPILDLSYDYKRPQIQSFNGKRYNEIINKDIKSGSIELCKKTVTTEYMVLHSGVMGLLCKYSRQEDIIIGTPISGRIHKDIENVVGMFVNTLPLRAKPNKEKSYIKFLNEVKDVCLKGYENQEYPLEEIIEDIQLNRDMSRNPLFDVMFSFENNEEVDFDVVDTEFVVSEYDDNLAKFDLSFDLKNNNNGYDISLQYCTDLFKETTIKNLISHYKKILKEIINNPEQLIKDIEIITSDEKNKILNKFNDTNLEFDFKKTLPEIFENRVNEIPDNIAVIYEDKKVSYSELNEKANIIANKIRELGIKPNEFVAIIAEKSIEAIYGILGVIKSGACYVPIDPNYPKERKDYIINDCKPKVILSYKAYNMDYNIPIIDLEDERNLIGDSNNPKIINNSNDLAYVIYTSGTTGKPKGVMLEEKGLYNVVKSYEKIYEITYNDVILQFASISFDQSVWDIFTSILLGATLCMIPSDLFANKELFVKYLNDKNVTVAALTPAFINELDPEQFKSLRLIESGGAMAKKEILDKWTKYVKVYNTYGPTETTINALSYRYIGNEELSNIPIGKPINNTKVYVMNDGKLCGVGIPGELCITGIDLARGYLNRDDLTNEKFINNPFGEGRLYKTGDLVKWLPDGNILCLGRIDEQVKIRGFRIELGEIENVVMKMENIKDVVVTVRENDGNSALYGYFVADKKISYLDIISYLEKELPEYMIPQSWMQLDALPLNKNGKVDKKALPEIEIKSSREYVPPSNEKENILVGIMIDILGIDKVGINDSFFELGGDSIKAIRIVSKVREAGYVLTVKDLMKSRTIGLMSKEMKKLQDTITYEQNEVTGICQSTPILKDFHNANFTKENHYNQALVFKCKDKIDEDILKISLRYVVKHHDILRSVYKDEKLIILSEEESKLVDFYVFNVETNSVQEDIKRESEYLQENIDLVNGPLIKVALFKGDESDYLMICIHHLIIDGVSWRILMDDLQNAYIMVRDRKEVILPKKTASYKMWAESLIEYSTSNTIKKEINYWNEVNSQIDKNRDINNIEIKEDRFELDSKLTNKLLYEVGKAYSTEVQEILLTSLAMALNKLNLNNKVSILLEGHGREEIHKPISIDRTIGWFTSKYPIVIKVGNNIEEHIMNTTEMMRKIPNNGMGYGVIKSYVNTKEKYIEPDICFNYLGEMDNEFNENDLFNITNLSAGRDSSILNKEPYNLSFNGGITDGKLRFNISYNCNIYNNKNINDLKNYLNEELEGIINFCCAKDETIKTASDYDENLTNDVLDEIMDMFE